MQSVALVIGFVGICLMLFREKYTAKQRHYRIHEAGDYDGYPILYSHLVVGLIVLTTYAMTVSYLQITFYN